MAAVKKMKLDVLAKLADEIHALLMKEKALNEQVDELKKQRSAKEDLLLAAAAKANQTKGGNSTVTWGIKEEAVPQVKDREQVANYIYDNRALHLLQFRPSVKSCQEMWELGLQVPGIEKFAKFKVTVKGV